jgi:cytochrome P450
MTAPPLGEYDARFAPLRDDPFGYYARARQEQPVHYVKSADAWMVTRYDDIRAVLSDPVRFSAAPGVPTPADNTAPEVLAILRTGLPLGRVIINEDPPSHTQLRRAAVRAMPPRRAKALRPFARQFAHELIDGFEGDQAAEIVWQYCDPFAYTIVQTLIGIPRGDQRQCRDWNDDMITLSLPFPTTEVKCEAARGFVAYQRYIAKLIERCRTGPRDDVISDLAAAPLPQDDLVALVWGFSAGKNSTRDALGTCLLTLLSSRERWERACAEPDVIPVMFEENLRFQAPLRGVFRITTAAVELGGITLPPGARLYVLYASGNRDEAHFHNPDVFNPGREGLGDHLGFGAALHRCLGSAVARATAPIAIQVLTERIPELRLAKDIPPAWLDRYYFHGLKKLQVRW